MASAGSVSGGHACHRPPHGLAGRRDAPGTAGTLHNTEPPFLHAIHYIPPKIKKRNTENDDGSNKGPHLAVKENFYAGSEYTDNIVTYEK